MSQILQDVRVERKVYGLRHIYLIVDTLRHVLFYHFCKANMRLKFFMCPNEILKRNKLIDNGLLERFENMVINWRLSSC